MDYLPLFIQLTNLPVLVVGGGHVAARKISLLRAAGAAITVVAPAACAELTALAAGGHLKIIFAEFAPELLGAARLVIAATDDHPCNATVAACAKRARLWVNVVDNAALSNCILPAIIDRSPVIVACSTGGEAPLLATHLRAQIETLLPPTLGALAKFMGRYRQTVKQALPDTTARRRLWHTVLQGELGTQVLRGEQALAEAGLRALLIAPADCIRRSCHVVGVTEESPDALTLRAARSLTLADTVYYDVGLSSALTSFGRRDAVRHCVGPAASAFDFLQSRLALLAPDGPADLASVYLSSHPAAWLDLLGGELRAREVLTQVG